MSTSKCNCFCFLFVWLFDPKLRTVAGFYYVNPHLFALCECIPRSKEEEFSGYVRPIILRNVSNSENALCDTTRGVILFIRWMMVWDISFQGVSQHIQDVFASLTLQFTRCHAFVSEVANTKSRQATHSRIRSPTHCLQEQPNLYSLFFVCCTTVSFVTFGSVYQLLHHIWRNHLQNFVGFVPGGSRLKPGTSENHENHHSTQHNNCNYSRVTPRKQ